MCRRDGIGQGKIHHEPAGAAKLRALEAESTKPKRLLPEKTLNNENQTRRLSL